MVLYRCFIITIRMYSGGKASIILEVRKHGLNWGRVLEWVALSRGGDPGIC